MPPSLHHRHGSLLDCPQDVHFSLVLGSPELDSALQVGPPQCRAVEKDHLPQPAGSTLPHAAQGTDSHLGSKGTMFTLIPSLDIQPGPFLHSCFPAGWPCVAQGSQVRSSLQICPFRAPSLPFPCFLLAQTMVGKHPPSAKIV